MSGCSDLKWWTKQIKYIHTDHGDNAVIHHDASRIELLELCHFEFICNV